ncbi:MAG TPA: hypothetical protein VFT74_08585, partial [Isosphaeraceae bacterium]|nr:hypothetical protein [Isosphaeraceae bacterium]
SYLNRLDPAERQSLEAEALAAADEQARQNYGNPALSSFRDALMQGMLQDLIRKRLCEQKSASSRP